MRSKWRLGGGRARVAEGHQRFPVAGAFLTGDVPLRDNQRQDPQC
jgi:hypothetical protein